MRTEIPPTGILKCHKCGAENRVNIDHPSVYATCDCGTWICGRQDSHPTATDVLTLFGFNLGLDWDGALTVESNEPVPAAIRKWLFDNQGHFRSSLECRRRLNQKVFVGGSLAGQPHCEGYWTDRSAVIRKIGPRHWEAYKFRDNNDPRLYYVGRATSEAKAKKGQFSEATP